MEPPATDIFQYKRPGVAVDVILFTIKDNDLKVGLEKWTTHFEPIRGKILAQALANLIEEKLRNQIVYPKDFIS